MPHLLEVEGLTTVFDSDYGRTVSVDHVNFHVDKGEVVCIVGESGCGKSVTSLSIMGLLGRGGTVTEGSVVFEDKNLLTMTEKELDKIRGDRLTMIFQDPLTSLDPADGEHPKAYETVKRRGAKAGRADFRKSWYARSSRCHEKISPYPFRRHAPACDDRDGSVLQSGPADRR